MIDILKCKKSALTVKYSNSLNRAKKSIFCHQSSAAIKFQKSSSSDYQRIAINEFNQGLSWLKPTVQSNQSLTSINAQTRDKSRNTNNYVTNGTSLISLQSSKYAFGQSLSRTESNRLKTIEMMKRKLTNRTINPIANKCIGSSRKTINKFRSKPISQLTKYLNSNKKTYQILDSKKRIPYILPQNKDLDYKLTPESFLYQAYFSEERNRTKGIHKHINILHREIMLDYVDDFRIIHSNVFDDYKLCKSKSIEGDELLTGKKDKKRHKLKDTIQS